MTNGGFPEPPDGEPIRVVAARHEACGETTRVRLPHSVPAGAVRRVQCACCERPFEADGVEEIAPTKRSASLGEWAWGLISLAIAAAAVVGGLLLIQGTDEEATVAAPAAQGAAQERAPANAGPERAASPPASRSNDPKPAKTAELVRASSYSLALPEGWRRIDPPSGATFAAVSGDRGADATLWIEEDPELEFADFIGQSLAQLDALAGSARIVERAPAPTPEATVVRLAASPQPGQPRYEVTLRAAGPYRYHLATSVRPDASREAVRGAELVAGSFTPEGSR
ncbi:MAG: hypothetical protein ACRDLO_12775 [Solirubrobacterales bacterium]